MRAKLDISYSLMVCKRLTPKIHPAPAGFRNLAVKLLFYFIAILLKIFTWPSKNIFEPLRLCVILLFSLLQKQFILKKSVENRIMHVQSLSQFFIPIKFPIQLGNECLQTNCR